MKVRLLRSAVIFINGNPYKFVKGAIAEVSEDVLRDCWQIMSPITHAETAAFTPATPLVNQKSQKATIKATEVRHRK